MLQISREVLNDSTWLAVADEAINSPLILKKKYKNSLTVKEITAHWRNLDIAK